MRTGGLSAFVDDALELLPKDKLAALFEEKLKTSPEFKALFEKLQHTDFQKLVEFYNVSLICVSQEEFSSNSFFYSVRILRKCSPCSRNLGSTA